MAQVMPSLTSTDSGVRPAPEIDSKAAPLASPRPVPCLKQKWYMHAVTTTPHPPTPTPARML